MFQPERKFGVVVVGVGRAGSVRIRDLRNPHASSAFLNLIGFVSRCLVMPGKTRAWDIEILQAQERESRLWVIPENCVHAQGQPHEISSWGGAGSWGAGSAAGRYSESACEDKGKEDESRA